MGKMSRGCDPERDKQFRNDVRDPVERAKLGVMQPWTMDGPTLRMQAVLVSAVRGCDGAPKDDPSKSLMWALRADTMVPSEIDWHPWYSGSFMGYKKTLNMDVGKFVGSLDQYPFHFVMHLTHAAEIVGTYHPIERVREWWWSIYERIVRENLHANVETKDQLVRRLDDY